MPDPRLSLIVPTLNERDNIPLLAEEVAAALTGIEYEIIYADSASDDGTQEAVQSLAESGQPVRLLALPRSASLSAACIAGAESALAPSLAVCDADLQHDLALLPRLLEALEQGADLAVGSRYIAGGSSGNGLSPSRLLLSRGATVATRLALGVRLSDPMSGYFALKRSVFQAARPRIEGEGFKILLDIILALPQRPRVAELPYTMRPRASGTSKLGAGVLVAASRQLAKGAVRRLRPRG